VIALLCLGHAAHPGVPGAGLYLQGFDFEAAHDAHALPGSGRATFTGNLAEAKRFADMAEMHRFYCTIPEANNRPMTGYHWQIVTVPE
jgi:hypothetical protein